MKVAVIALAGLITLTSVGGAASDEEDLSNLTQALFYHMAGTYICRDALGGLAHYQAARSIAVVSLTRYVGNDQAILYVDEMDQKFKADPRAKNPELDDARCLEAINDSLYKVNVAKAKMRK